MAVRDVARLVYKIGMIAATVALSFLAYAAYRSSTPGTGDVLLSWILGILAFLALLSIPKLDWQDEQAETYRKMLDDVRKRLSFNVEFTSGNEPGRDAATASTIAGRMDLGSPVTVNFAEPEVHRVDANMVTEAKQMAAAGASLDDICRVIDPDHDGHDPMHREAFRRIVQAMVSEG